MNFPDEKTLAAARERIRPHARVTPVQTCGSLDAMAGCRLYFKCENFQKVGAFKFRGASNAVFSLEPESAARGVATHSSGNHAQAVALAARMRGIPAHIVMPDNAPRVKVEAVRGYGGRVVFCEPTLKAREAMLGRVVDDTGAAFIHPYNDWRVIAGQSTCAMELIEAVPGLDVILAPVGGGGLLSGTALAVHYADPEIRVIAAEPAGADDAYRSFKSGALVPSDNPRTVADGLLTSLGELTFAVIRKHVADIVTVSEEYIISAMRHILERMKVLVEPSAAVPFGAILEKRIDVAGKRVGIILSGGNTDLDRLPWCVKK